MYCSTAAHQTHFFLSFLIKNKLECICPVYFRGNERVSSSCSKTGLQPAAGHNNWRNFKRVTHTFWTFTHKHRQLLPINDDSFWVLLVSLDEVRCSVTVESEQSHRFLKSQDEAQSCTDQAPLIQITCVCPSPLLLLYSQHFDSLWSLKSLLEEMQL